MFNSYFHSYVFIAFLWGNVAFVRVQCRSTTSILEESKSSGQMELCLTKCGINVRTDVRGISTEEISTSHQSCYYACLGRKGKLAFLRNNTILDLQMTSFSKRSKRDMASFGCHTCETCPNDTEIRYLNVSAIFGRLNNSKMFYANISWKPVQNDAKNFNWTGYQMMYYYDGTYRCEQFGKNVTNYVLNNSPYGLKNGYYLEVLVFTMPFITRTKPGEFQIFVVKDTTTDDQTTPSTRDGPTSPSTADDPTTPSTTAYTAKSTKIDDSTSSSTTDNKKTVVIVVTLTACAILVAALIFWYFWFRRSRKSPSSEEQHGESWYIFEHCRELEFEYDAFIIYSSYDSEWVTVTLLPTLEEKHGFKCCVHYRDFALGVPFRDNMVASVYKSRKTIAVVSKNFFNSNYCGSELDFALHRLIERRDDSLIVIKLDDVDRDKLPLELKQRSYIDFPKLIEKETWEKKMVKCLKSTSLLTYPQKTF